MFTDVLWSGRLGRQLVQAGVLSRLQCVEAFALAQAAQVPVEQVLVERGYATEQQLEQARLGLWRMVQLG